MLMKFHKNKGGTMKNKTMLVALSAALGTSLFIPAAYPASAQSAEGVKPTMEMKNNKDVKHKIHPVFRGIVPGRALLSFILVQQREPAWFSSRSMKSIP